MPLRSRPFPFAVVVALVALLLVACIRDGSPQLIQVLEVAPREAEVGDRIEILGAGFPQGKPAHLAFRGTLYRPGERALDDAEIVVEATVRNARQIELVFTEALQALFCGAGGQAAHTTFDGELEVAFSAATPSAPPIAATLYKVSLDVRPPPPRPAVALAQDAEGERALQFLGIATGLETPPSGGLVIEKVAPGSRADQAGVVAGDVLVKVDGVRVATKADAVPSPGAQNVSLAVRRGTDPREQLKQVAFDGFKPAAPAELLGAAVLLALAAAIVLLFLAPSGAGSAWIERRLAARLGSTDAHAVPQDPAFWIVGATVSALVVVAPFRQYRFAATLDVGIVFLVLVSGLLTAALLTGGGAPRWSVADTARAAWRLFSGHVPAALAVMGVVVVAGSLRVQDIVRAQGGAPWDWYAFRSPITLALFVAFVVGIFADGDDAPSTLVEAASPIAPPDAVAETPRVRLFAIARHVGLFASSAMAATLFLGGWQIPGLNAAQTGSALFVGAGLFVAKTWGLVFAVTVARRTMPSLRGHEAAGMAWKYLVPVALAAIALAAGWRLWSPPRALDKMVSGVLFVLVVLLVAQLVQRVRYGFKSPHAQAHLNPFL